MHLEVLLRVDLKNPVEVIEMIILLYTEQWLAYDGETGLSFCCILLQAAEIKSLYKTEVEGCSQCLNCRTTHRVPTLFLSFPLHLPEDGNKLVRTKT